MLFKKIHARVAWFSGGKEEGAFDRSYGLKLDMVTPACNLSSQQVEGWGFEASPGYIVNLKLA